MNRMFIRLAGAFLTLVVLLVMFRGSPHVQATKPEGHPIGLRPPTCEHLSTEDCALLLQKVPACKDLSTTECTTLVQKLFPTPVQSGSQTTDIQHQLREVEGIRKLLELYDFPSSELHGRRP